MKSSFDIIVRKQQETEIREFHQEVGERQEAYAEEARVAGFDNLHDYENHLSKKLVNRIFVAIGIIIFITGIISLV